MRIVSDRNGAEYLSGFETLTAEVYSSHPEYAAGRAASMARAVDRRNPFFRHGDYWGFLAYVDGRPVAHAAAVLDRRLESSTGLLGFFESLPDSAYAKGVVHEVVAALRERGVHDVRGPVDLTTWNGFRVSYPDDAPPFLLEPFTRGYYGSMFKELGFAIAHRSITTLYSPDDVGFDRFKGNFETLRAEGFTFTSADRDNLPSLLRDVHSMAVECFSNTWSFVPISFPEFEYGTGTMSQCTKLLLLLVAHSPSGGPVGFCLGALDAVAGHQRAVVKTVAAAPVRQRLKIARALLFQFFEAAMERGATEFILSTMRDDNMQVRALTAGRGTVYRRYEAYELNVGEGNP